MSTFNCIPCDYNTPRKSDHKRHMKSKKHKKRVAHCNKVIVHITIHKCNYCGSTFKSASSLSRHKNACSEKMNLEKENNILKRENKIYKELIKLLMPSKSLNYYEFITTNYINSPALKDKQPHTNIIESKTKIPFIIIIILSYKKKTLVKLISDYIIKLYKKDNPKIQSLWSTDVSRLTYLISKQKNQKETVWIYDKKGIKVKEIIIEPILSYISNELINFAKENAKSIDESMINNLVLLIDIKDLIDKGILANNILRYITPWFSINVNN